MIILERMLELTEDDKESLEIREDILSNLVQDQYLPSIARSVHFDKFLSLFEKLSDYFPHIPNVNCFFIMIYIKNKLIDVRN